MEKKYRVTVFGKKGCNKCKVLNERLDSLLKQAQWQDFEKSYIDVATIDGLVKFVKLEALNPQRIPSLLIEKSTGDGYKPLLNPKKADENSSTLPWHYVGVETDYSEKGKGIITPQMVTSVLESAKGL